MINYELKPTAKNIKETLLKDSLGRNSGIARFVELLNALEENNVIAIDDSWGNGKTFFVKQLQLVLRSYILSTDEAYSIRECVPVQIKPDELRSFIPIYYDAWINDNDYDPVLSIVNDMLREVVGLKGLEVSNNDWIKTLIASADLIVKTCVGPQIKDFLTALRSESPLEGIKKQKKLDELLNALFDEILKNNKPNTYIVFIIDELDRCCPSFAVKVLERIKHYFYHEKVIFIISTNIKELQHAVKRQYGNEFDACKYLNRFFDFTITLPLPDYERYYGMLDFTHHSYLRDDLTYYIIKYYNFSLRDITRYLQVLRIVIPEKYRGYDNDEVHIFYMEILVPFLLGLKIHNVSQYEDFIHGDNPEPLLELLQNGDADKYCCALLDKNETFNTNSEKKFIPIKDRLYKFYDAFFGVDSRGADNPVEIKIGKNVFLSSDKKIWIMNVVSFLLAKVNL